VVVLVAGGGFIAYQLIGGDKDSDTQARTEAQGAASAAQQEAQAAQRLEQMADNPADHFIESMEGLLFSALDSTRLLSQAMDAIPSQEAFSLAGRSDASLTLAMGSNARDKLAAEFSDIPGIRNIINLVFDSGLHFASGYDINANSVQGGMQGEWRLGGGSILSLDVFLDGNTLYAAIPELYNRYISVNLAQFGFDAYDLISELENPGDMLGMSDDPTQQMADLLQFLENNDGAIRALAGRAVAALFAEVKDVSFDSGVSMGVANKPTAYNRFSVSVTEKEFAAAIKSVFEMVRDDEAALGLLVDFMNLIDTAYYTKEGLREDIAGFILEMENESVYDDETVTFSVYLHPATNKVTGFEMSADDWKWKCVLDISHGYELQFGSVYEQVRIWGGLSGSADDFAGDLWFEFENISTQLMEFAVKYDLGDRPRLDLRVVMHMKNLLNVLEDEVSLSDLPASLADLLFNAELVVAFSTDPQKLSGYVELANRNEQISIKYAMDMQMDADPNLVKPNVGNAVDINNINDAIMRDVFVLLGNVSQLLEKIEDMGYDMSLLTDMLFGAMF
jgi:hypothetical protein